LYPPDPISVDPQMMEPACYSGFLIVQTCCRRSAGSRLLRSVVRVRLVEAGELAWQVTVAHLRTSQFDVG
jgi:hypothetical protein